jgi:hypothetical protein
MPRHCLTTPHTAAVVAVMRLRHRSLRHEQVQLPDGAVQEGSQMWTVHKIIVAVIFWK